MAMKKLFLAGVAALLLATGAAQADAVYDDFWDWSGCKEEPGPQNDEQYYSCENGHDFGSSSNLSISQMRPPRLYPRFNVTLRIS